MSTPFINAIELAFATVIGTAIAGSGATVLPGKSSAIKTLPLVICGADGSSQEEDPRGTGNFWVDVEITIKASAATEAGAGVDPVLAANTLTVQVLQAIMVSNLDALLNAAGQLLTVMPNGFFFGAPKQGQDGDGAWVDVLPIRLYCCNSVLAP